MTKREFWRLVESSIETCNCCPVKIHRKNRNQKCDDCAESLQETYSSLEDEEKQRGKEKEHGENE